jgi:hypothetical protein
VTEPVTHAVTMALLRLPSAGSEEGERCRASAPLVWVLGEWERGVWGGERRRGGFYRRAGRQRAGAWRWRRPMVGLGEAMANGRAFPDVWAARSDDVAGLASAEEGTITGKERGRAGEEFCVRALVCRAFGSVGHGRVLLIRVGLVWAVCVGSMLRGGPALEGQGQIHGLAQT